MGEQQKRHEQRKEYKHSSAHVLAALQGPASSRHKIFDPILALFGQQFSVVLIFVLLIGAAISQYLGDEKTAGVMLVVAVINSLISLKQRHRTPSQTMSEQLSTRLIQVGVTLAAVLGLTALVASFDLDTTLIYAVAIAVACMPSGLITWANLLLAQTADKLTDSGTYRAVRSALTDSVAQLSIVLISLVAQVISDIPLALVAVQILAIDVLLQMAPLAALKADKPLHKLKNHVFGQQSRTEIITFGMLAAMLAYLNFLFFFERRGFTPVNIDSNSHLYAQATTVTVLALVLCQFVNLLLVRADEHQKVFTKHLWSNKKLFVASSISFALLGNIIYNPWVSPYFHTEALSIGDLLTAVAVAIIYTLIRFTQRHTRQHTRGKLLEDHDHETLRQHPRII